MPEILSIYLGALDVNLLVATQLAMISGCPQEAGDEGLPIVVSAPLDGRTLDPEDFEVRTVSKEVNQPTCATLRPAFDPDELATILLTGPLCTSDDLVASVTIVGEVSALDGTPLTGAESERVTTFMDGPSLVLAYLDPAGPTCATLGSSHEIQTVGQGGVSAEADFQNGVFIGPEPGEEELAAMRVFDASMQGHPLLGFDDLGDGDNYLVVCVPAGVDPVSITVEACTLFDPTNNPNPATEVEVLPRPIADSR